MNTEYSFTMQNFGTTMPGFGCTKSESARTPCKRSATDAFAPSIHSDTDETSSNSSSFRSDDGGAKPAKSRCAHVYTRTHSPRSHAVRAQVPLIDVDALARAFGLGFACDELCDGGVSAFAPLPALTGGGPRSCSPACARMH